MLPHPTGEITIGGPGGGSGDPRIFIAMLLEEATFTLSAAAIVLTLVAGIAVLIGTLKARRSPHGPPRRSLAYWIVGGILVLLGVAPFVAFWMALMSSH